MRFIIGNALLLAAIVVGVRAWAGARAETRKVIKGGRDENTQA
jgi:hypothetical protein